MVKFEGVSGKQTVSDMENRGVEAGQLAKGAHTDRSKTQDQ